jgi:hypothetical protein
LRGGSWNNNLDNARVAIRNNNHPDNQWNNNGFRVAALHSFPEARKMASCATLKPAAPSGYGRRSRQNWPACDPPARANT